ncbi:MAG: hypothetical protein KDC12_02785 [Flavobacteriales bacterium]|nr:hypothetical protein [Flavobacteriales bacterium]
MKRTLLAGILWMAAHSLFAQCTDCIPDETCINDTDFPQVCPEVMPAATAGEAYDEQMTFFLPAQVTDPGSGVTVDLIEVVITSVQGLPFGLEYIMNHPDNTYYPNDGDTWGCATICGTPLLAGEYAVSINAHVTTLAFGFEVEVDQPFESIFSVLPGEGGNNSFTFDNVAGCGSMDVNFEALINADPQPTTWFWDFDNGNTSASQFPATQTFNGAGDYLVSLETTIYDYVLTDVLLSSLAGGWSGDIEELTTLQNPDPYFVITNSSGVAVYTSSSLTDVQSGSWTGLNIILSDPPYTISFYDEDSISNDDFLGTGDMPGTDGTYIINAGGSTCSVNIGLQAGDTFYDETVFSVFPAPNTAFTIDEDANVLYYSDETLTSFLWLNQGDTLATQDTIINMSTNGGVYECMVTNIYGCEGWSSPYVHCPELTVQYDQELNQLLVPDIFESYQWFYNGLEISGATANFIFVENDGNYSVEVTTSYGCESMSTVITINTYVQEFTAGAQMKTYPNPASDHVTIELDHFRGSGAQFEWRDAVGNLLEINMTRLSDHQWEAAIDHLPNGLYTLSLWEGNHVITQRIVKQ